MKTRKVSDTDESMMQVDYVIPFVDCSERDWVGTYRKYVPDDCSWSSNATRFRDWDILRYQLRSISRHLPWIHRIYIVLSVSKAQTPKWLNLSNEKIRVVWDWEFVPEEYLPTFNSNVIDLFIPRIDGLAEHYLYACDDYLIMRDLQPDDFFSKNGIKIKLNNSIFPPSVYTETIKNSVRLIRGMDCPIPQKGGKYLLPYCDHAIVPHRRSANLKVLDGYGEEIRASLSRFRERKNLTWLIYVLHMAQAGRHEDGRLRSRYCPLYTEESIQQINFNECDVITLNDEYHENFYRGKVLLERRLEEILPDTCEYEILQQ